MRDYTITKKSGELHNCEVTDSNGKILEYKLWESFHNGDITI